MKIEKRDNRKIIKSFLILLSLIISIITIYEIAKIYAVFYSESSGTLSQDIAKWKIVINGTNIASETEQDFEISKFNIQNLSALNGKFAPGMTGYFEIAIEPKDTQVSVRYDIFINDSNIVDSEIKLISVEETEVNNTIIRTDEKTYTGIIPLSSIKDNYINNIKITFEWEDDGSDNTENIEVGDVKIPVIQIPISIKASQYIGEEIIAYTD